MKARKFDLEFVKKIKLTKDTFEFYFQKPKRFNFKPGQYLKVRLDIKNPDERGSSRYFTISSTPLNKECLTITTRVIKSSFKKKFARLKKNDLISAFGPIGYFSFDIKNKKPKIFLAAGMGITPYHSILTTIKNKKNLPKITLIASFSKIDEVIYFNQLKQIEKENPKIKIVFTLTKEKTLRFEEGRIDKKLIAKYAPDYKRSEFFVVGSEAAEEGLLTLLKQMRINRRNIFSENFPGY